MTWTVTVYQAWEEYALFDTQGGNDMDSNRLSGMRGYHFYVWMTNKNTTRPILCYYASMFSQHDEQDDSDNGVLSLDNRVVDGLALKCIY